MENDATNPRHVTRRHAPASHGPMTIDAPSLPNDPVKRELLNPALAGCRPMWASSESEIINPDAHLFGPDRSEQ
jgi:hypothetical protein